MHQIKDIVTSVLNECSSPKKTKRHQLITKWPQIAGPKISPHTKPSLTAQGDVYVWVNQSALAFELNQKYRTILLKRIQAQLGEQAVKNIYFRVGQLR